jgi:Domain of unknown function (DUF4349)
MTPKLGRARSGRALVALALIAIVLAACGTGSAAPVAAPVDGTTADQSQAKPAIPGAISGSGNSSDQTGSGSGGTAPVLYDPSTPNLQIIKTGTLTLQVDGLDAALANATQKIAALGGYTSGSQRQGDGDKSMASVTYRIPAQRWDDALVALRGLATKILGEQTQTEDVTTKIVDLSARIANLQATEQALQGIMLKATKISDILAVQAQLTETRGQIEQATADRKHLTEQATFSTLTVTYSLKEQAVVATTKKFDPAAEVDRASANLVDVFQSLATAGIWFGIVWLPILVALGLFAFVFAFILRRVLRSRPGPGPRTWPGAPSNPGAGDLAAATSAEG